MFQLKGTYYTNFHSIFLFSDTNVALHDPCFPFHHVLCLCAAPQLIHCMKQAIFTPVLSSSLHPPKAEFLLIGQLQKAAEGRPSCALWVGFKFLYKTFYIYSSQPEARAFCFQGFILYVLPSVFKLLPHMNTTLQHSIYDIN